MMVRRTVCGITTALLVLILLTGCGGPPRVQTTFLGSVDLIDMTNQMAQSFARDEAISARRATDEPWVISIYRVVNHTNQVIPERERWLYIGRMRSLLAQSDIATQRRLIWIVPPERWPAIARELGEANEPPGLRMNPTHLLTAEFNTLTTTSARGRSDMYVCSYQLVDLATGLLVWEDSWEVKRSVTGLTFD